MNMNICKILAEISQNRDCILQNIYEEMNIHVLITLLGFNTQPKILSLWGFCIPSAMK